MFGFNKHLSDCNEGAGHQLAAVLYCTVLYCNEGAGHQLAAVAAVAVCGTGVRLS